MTGALRRRWDAVRAFLAAQEELHARVLLAARPWEEEFLHWSGDRLHGHLVPPPGRRGLSTTRSGWCPAQDAELTRRSPAARMPRG